MATEELPIYADDVDVDDTHIERETVATAPVVEDTAEDTEDTAEDKRFEQMFWLGSKL